MFNKKFSSNIRKKKRMITSSIILLVVLLGLGYAAFTTNLGINGTLTVDKYDQTLYGVLEKAAKKGTYAKKYTGNHHDSFTEEPSKDIYHWWADNDTNGTAILDKNNVIFADHCWQMIRTTDTGGIKMLYNGEAENNQCLNTRGTHVGYASRTTQSMSTTYYYGTSYTYDKTNNVFSLDGTITTGTIQTGQYTCKQTTSTGTCGTIYLVDTLSSGTTYYVLPLNSSSNYSQFGTLQFNESSKSPAYTGYMYGDIYSNSYTNATTSQSFTRNETLLKSESINTNYWNYWYAENIDYGNIMANKYSLIDPYKENASSYFSRLVGKYTFRNSNQTYTAASIYYIAGVKSGQDNYQATMYYKYLENGNLLSAYDPIVFGSSITDNGNGTYTINNPISVSLTDWYTDYANYTNKYTCNDSNTTCTYPRYTTATTATNYTYINAGEKIMIGKTRNGVTLTDTLLVRKDELIINSSNYSDYKYTCNTDSAICTESTLRMILGYSTTGYNYASNHYYGSKVTWDGTNYTLVDPIEIENYNNLNNISTHHYMCVSNGLKTCQTVAYVYYYTGSGTMYYITLRDGITTVGKALEDMLTKNTTNSIMKIGVDAWYKHYLLKKYDNYIEDTIFCNDRSIHALNGWNPNGGSTTEYLQFKEYNLTSDLSCTNTTDRFSVSNPSATLTYKVGLLSSPEMNILNNENVRKTGKGYWLASPYYFNIAYCAYCRVVYDDGSMYSFSVTYVRGVRPAISLKPGTEYASGTGSMADPYVVE